MQLLWLVFLAGLTGGFGHCIGMCGGIVTACSFAGCARERAAPDVPLFQILYHSGRLLTYAALGAVLGILGALPGFSAATQPLQRWVPVIVGVLMIGMGVSMALFRGSARIATAYPGKTPGLFSKALGILTARGTATAFPLGLLMGFLPCGMLAAIELRALATGSALWGGAVMLAFGLGTVPALLGFGLAGGLVSARLRGTLLRLGAVIVVIMGILTVVHGFEQLGFFGLRG